MKKIYLFIGLTLIVVFVQAQFSSRTEYEYLKLINQQQKKELINDNLKNAEIAAQKFINDTNNLYTGLFFEALSNSYKILNNKSLSLYYSIIQRILFPMSNESIADKLFFSEICFANNLTDSLVDYYWTSTQKEHLWIKAQDKFLLILKLMIPLYSKHLTRHLYQLGNYILDSKNEIPQWLANWFYLTKIKVSEKRKQQLINYNDTAHVSIFEATSSKKQKFYIYRKSIRFYTRINAHNKAKSLIAEYSNQQLSPFRRCQLLWYKSKLKFNLTK